MHHADRKEHWESVYRTKNDHELSWHQDHLENSLRLILSTGVGQDGAIVDVGGGSSTLIDDLLDRGFGDLSVLDISSAALERSRARLGKKAEKVKWISADVTDIGLPEFHYDVWHDRAVFHFLTDPEDRRKYVDLVLKSVKTGGHVIVASFAADGPKKCSGLEVVCYSPQEIRAEFGELFQLRRYFLEPHSTPFSTTQEFVYCHLQKLDCK